MVANNFGSWTTNKFISKCCRPCVWTLYKKLTRLLCQVNKPTSFVTNQLQKNWFRSNIQHTIVNRPSKYAPIISWRPGCVYLTNFQVFFGNNYEPNWTEFFFMPKWTNKLCWSRLKCANSKLLLYLEILCISEKWMVRFSRKFLIWQKYLCYWIFSQVSWKNVKVNFWKPESTCKHPAFHSSNCLKIHHTFQSWYFSKMYVFSLLSGFLKKVPLRIYQ